jgi:ectoine hydroxylase
MKTIDTYSFIDEYQKKGYFKSDILTSQILNFEDLLDENTEKVFEKDAETLRSVYCIHHNNIFRNWLSNQSTILSIVSKLIGNEFYLHQTKVNIKNQDETSVWPFHRDFPFWKHFDHIPENKMLNVVVFLDNVDNDSGELELVPGSHTEFLERESEDDKVNYSLDGSASSDLLFNFTADEIRYFKNKFGSEKITGTKGTVFFFNPDVIHGSANSLKNFSRKILILTFNSCSNLPSKKSKRPEYLCSTHYAPIK